MYIKSITAEFENGDVLTLKLTESTFAGYQPAKLWELFYGERVEGNHESISDDEPVSEDPHFFNVFNTEYFASSMFDTAKCAFNKRLTCSNPKNESDMGLDLNRFLERK